MKNNNSIQRCDFRMHDVIDGKYRVALVLGSSSTDQRFKVVDTNGGEYILTLYKLWEVELRLQKGMLLSSDSEIKSCQIKSHYLTDIVHTGVVKGNPYVLTDYCNSVELSRCIGHSKMDVVMTAKAILYGLRDLHQSGKVHCQLTADNILITENGCVKITNYVILGGRGDVLISKNKMLRSQMIETSLAYQAPELYRLERCATVLPSLDIFSFGVILFQLLTGELPYGRLRTESDWIHYQSRVKNNDWNRNLLLRHEEREMWMEVLEACLAADTPDRAKNVDDIIEKFPTDEYRYEGVSGSHVEAPATILNGVMLRVMQGDEFNQCYRLIEIMQSPKRIITIGRTDSTVFNMIQLSENTSSYISRRHCTIELDDETDTWYLRDGQWDKETKEKWTRSLNGTYINTKKITEDGEKLALGDVVSIGDIKLRVEAY